MVQKNLNRKKFPLLNNSLMLAAFFIIVFVIGADSFIISPLLPAIEKSFHISLTASAFSVTIYALCYAIGSPFFSPLGDSFDKKKLLSIGIGIFLLGSIFCAISANIQQFYLFRAFAGIGAALTLPNIWASIASYFHGKTLNTVMGITMSALSLSIAIGVPLGTGLSQLSNWHMAFWASAALTLIAYAVLLLVVPHMPVGKIFSAKSYAGSFQTLLKTSKAIPALLINLFWMFGFYTIYTFLGSHLHQVFALNTAEIGYFFIAYGVSNFLASFFGGFVTTKLGAMQSVVINGSCSAVMVLSMGLTGKNVYLLIMLLIMLALFQGLGVTALTTYIVNVIPKNRSTVMSFNSSFLYLALTLASALGAVIYTQWQFSGLSYSAFIALLLAVAMTGYLHWKS